MSNFGKLFPNVSVFENDDTTNKIETSKIFYTNNEKLINEKIFNYFNYSNYIMDTTKLTKNTLKNLKK